MKERMRNIIKPLYLSMGFEQALITDHNESKLFFIAVMMGLLLEISFLLFICISCLIIGISKGAIIMGIVLYIFLKIMGLKRKKDRKMHELIDEVNDFMFIYEMNLLKGMNQANSLRNALEASKLRAPTSEPEVVIDFFEQVYSYAKWMVIKKISILIERNQYFSKEDLSMEFTDVTKELFERYYRMKKLEIEKLENKALIPMTLNLMLMIGYMVIPFIIEFF